MIKLPGSGPNRGTIRFRNQEHLLSILIGDTRWLARFANHLGGSRVFRRLKISDEISVQVTIPIVIGECHHDAGTLKVQAEFGRFFRKVITSIDIQPVGAIKTTQIQVQPPIVININKSRAGRPHAIGLDAPCLGHIFKLHTT